MYLDVSGVVMMEVKRLVHFKQKTGNTLRYIRSICDINL